MILQTNAAKKYDRLMLLTNMEYDYTHTTQMLEAELMQPQNIALQKCNQIAIAQ